MPNRTEHNIVSAPPLVKISPKQKLAYGLVMAICWIAPPLATISAIPYMRNKKEGGGKDNEQPPEE